MELVLPTPEYKKSFLEAVKEYQSEGGSDDRGRRYRTLSVAQLESDFAAYVENEKGINWTTSASSTGSTPQLETPETAWIMSHL
jgi:hypothetical protein